MLDCDAPKARDLQAALNRGLAGGDDRKLLYLRTRLWWAGNDHIRRGKNPRPLTAAARKNLEALLELLDESEAENRLMKAEAARELGRFEEAATLLAKPFRRGLQQAAARLRALTAERSVTVSTL